MSPDDTGVTELLRRASDDLAPDVDRLVSGGIARGRSRRRRARIGTTVASLAVIGVVGGLAVVVPRAGVDSAGDPGVATDGPSETPSPEPTGTPTAPEQLREIPAAQVPEIALSLLQPPASLTLGEPDVHLDEPDQRVVRARLDGMITDFGMFARKPGSASSCREDAESMGGSCHELEEDLLLLTWGPVEADGVTCQGANVERARYEVWATSCNAAEAKESPPLAADPPLTVAQLAQIVANDYWFE
jgi:hypothetical protein